MQAALVNTLQRISRLNVCASESNSTDSGCLHLDKRNVCLVDYGYEAIWRMQHLVYHVILVYELQSRQRYSHLTRDRVDSFHAVRPPPPSIRSRRHHLDPTLISEGDLKLFDRAGFRNLRQSSLLVMSKMHSQMEFWNNLRIKSDEGLPLLPFILLSSIPFTIVSKRDLLYLLLYGFRTELAAMMHVNIHYDVPLLKVQKQRHECEN